MCISDRQIERKKITFGRIVRSKGGNNEREIICEELNYL